MTNLTPSVWRPQLLWSPDTVAVIARPPGQRP